MLWLQRGNEITNMIGGIVAALLLGFMLPKMVLQRLVKRLSRQAAGKRCPIRWTCSASSSAPDWRSIRR